MHIFIIRYAKHKASKNRKVVELRTPKPVCEHEAPTVLWNQEVHRDREVVANRPDIIIKREKRKRAYW
jgi:hypothetical protein